MSSQFATNEENSHKQFTMLHFTTVSKLSQIPLLITFVTEFYQFCDGILPSLNKFVLVVFES
jgi:hypothetical protein